MQYKNVDRGDTLTHVTLNNEEIAINFSKPYKYFAVSGNNTLLAALNGNIVEGADGVYPASNGIIIIQAKVPVNTVYVKGSDEADVWAGTTANSVPFGKENEQKISYVNYTQIQEGFMHKGVPNLIRLYSSKPSRICPLNNQLDYIRDINWNTDNWEIGVAISKLANDGKASIFAQGHPGWMFKYVPSMEWFDDNRLSMYYSSNGSNWNTIFTIQNFAELKQWVFVSVSYNSSTSKLIVKYTYDFKTFIENEYLITPYGNSDPVGFGYFVDASTHTNANVVFDLNNMYIKKNNTIIWGAYAGTFDTNEL